MKHTITFKTGSSPVISDGLDLISIVCNEAYLVVGQIEIYQGSALINHGRNISALEKKKEQDKAEKCNKEYGQAMKRLLEGSAFLRDLMKNF